MTIELTRRNLLKAQAAAIAASTAGIALPAAAQSVPGGVQALEIKWSKAPCRFCGTGCGVMVGVKENQVVATHGDMEAEVNRGLNCVKGYFLSKIMYGKDRLTTPLLRKRDGVYAKDGEFEPVTWEEAFDVMATQAKRVLKEKGPTALGMFGSGQWTIFEGYAATKLMRAGFRSNNLDPNAVIAWHRPQLPSCEPSAWTSRWAVTMISNTRTPLCSGVPTWLRCTRSFGRELPTGGWGTSMSGWRSFRPSPTAAWIWPISR